MDYADDTFRRAQEAVKTLPSLDDSNKLRLYAHYKQATVGPAQGSRPSMFNQVARAKWDAWSQLRDMSAAEAKRGYCMLADEFARGWRPASHVSHTFQSQESGQPTEQAVLCSDDEDRLFEAAQEAVKTLPSLDNSNKLRLYAHYKQATVGPAQGSRPSMFNQVARAKWDAWSQLGDMSAADAKRGYCMLADEFVPGWRPASQASHTLQSQESGQPTEQAVLCSDDEDRLFEAAQEAVKTLPSLDDSNKLRLYAHYKQATVGPAQGSRPSMFSQVARAKWDAWSQLGDMSAAEAKRGYCMLADEFARGWRPASQVSRTFQSQESGQPTEQAVLRSDDEDRLFEAAQEAVKTLPSLDDSNKLRLYAHYKQATVGPAQGSRPSMFNQVARAKWDAWSQLGDMSAAEAKRGYCMLADEFARGWRPASHVSHTFQSQESGQPTEQAVLCSDDEDRLFEAAQEAVKTLPSLDDSNKLRLYAHYKQATVGPAQGSRPSMFNQVARAKWDAWSQLGDMSAAEAKRGYCMLADEFARGWRPASQVSHTFQSQESGQPTDQAVLRSDDEDRLFEAAQEAVKTLPSLDDSNKLRLYAHYKQATVGPAQGSRPSIFNQVARAKWDAWSQLGDMSAAEAKRGYCMLADEFIPGWRTRVVPLRSSDSVSVHWACEAEQVVHADVRPGISQTEQLEIITKPVFSFHAFRVFLNASQS
ncbi:ACBD5 [Symbiodinium natans]|uniref:ACBD5 protein n=1 Tax=Symbiodinium natans TaxID=878477 RepID=A0A812TQ12_9DINO|nr:ACBD5 [Symbiodinium natans]